jgi:uncharacterized repeat protein (TIGR03803 family)
MKYHAATILRVTLAILTGMFVLLTANAFASQFTVLHNFYEKPAAYPNSGLIIGPDGDFYGTAGIEGATECPPKMCGVVFEIKHTSTGWQYHIVHKFHGPRHDGELPGGLIFDKAGNLYGTTFSFGHSTCVTHHTDCGTVFRLSPTAKGGWEETILYTFTGGADGAYPEGNLVLDSAGNFFGVTLGGGSFKGNLCSTFGCGVAYELSPGASGWAETVLYTFTGGSDGWRPEWLTADNNGNLLGVTYLGGTFNSTCGAGCGTVFKLTSGLGGWTLSVAYSFSGGNDGAYPSSQLIFDTQGNLFGTAGGGGSVHSAQCIVNGGCGTVFELSPNGSGWNFSGVYSFSGTDGELPRGILFDSSGNLFGAADGGKPACPAEGCGVLFKLVPSSGNWAETVLYKFKDTTDGEFPSPVIMDSAGNLFGTADGGGARNLGTIFEFTP